MREDDKMKGYPTCKTCGMLMTEFDDWHGIHAQNVEIG